MNDKNEPDDRYLERLEWQLASEFRRASRLKPAAARVAVPRSLVATVCLAGVLTTGVTVLRAAEYIKDSWRKKIEIARAETDVKLKRVHLESTEAMKAEAAIRASKGLVWEEEYRVIEASAEKADLELKRSELDLEEVKISGQSPRNELYAPEVGGRDFVSERLKLEKKAAEIEEDLVGIQMARFEQMVQQGLATENELEALQADFYSRSGHVREIKKRLDLRSRFLSGEIQAQEIEIMGRLTEAESNVQRARTRVDGLERQMNRLIALAAEGAVSETEVQQMQYALSAARAELELAELEKGILSKIE